MAPLSLPEASTIGVQLRMRSLSLLREEMSVQEAREIEAAAFSTSGTETTYLSHIKRVHFNVLHRGATPVPGTVARSDADLAKGTIVEAILGESKRRRQVFQDMVQEKCQETEPVEGSIRCRRCGSHDVQTEQKQTRSADEGCTVFCTCSKCGQRWKM